MTSDHYRSNLGLAFERVAAQHADRIALHFPADETSVTYDALNRRANRFACLLRRDGLGPDDVVAIFNEKTHDAFALMLACLKLGVIYTNLDVESPLPRLERMLDTCRPKRFIASAEQLARVGPAIETAGITTIALDDGAFLEQLNALPEDNPVEAAAVCGTNPAYLMFTSGSTGFPKGAVMTHAGVLNFIQWSRRRFDITADQILTSVNPIHFDNSVFDFYSALFTGASLAIFTAKATQNPRHLVKAVDAARCTIWFSVPSLLIYALRMRAFERDDLASMRTVIFGGEGFPKPQLKKLFDMFGERIEFENVYGPTECTCICSAYRVSESDFADMDNLLPLGRMAENFGCHILTEDGREASPGEIGELCLTGPNVGLGYYRDRERTAGAFVRNPFREHTDERMYKTGDLVRLNPTDGLIHICGRKDNQIKLMGHRIELEEIELAANRVDGVAECGVVLRRHGDGRADILAFASTTHELTEVGLLSDLRRLLPHYMIPASVTFMDTLPKNSSGKMDRQQLQRLASEQS
jgi:D-alanine--poly(phosphoribitol) ligase subunit 1